MCGELGRDGPDHDRQVVVPSPQLLDESSWGNYPAHTQAGQPESLRKATRDDRLFIVPPEGWGRGSGVHLGATIDFIGEQPGASATGGIDDGRHLVGA